MFCVIEINRDSNTGIALIQTPLTKVAFRVYLAANATVTSMVLLPSLVGPVTGGAHQIIFSALLHRLATRSLQVLHLKVSRSVSATVYPFVASRINFLDLIISNYPLGFLRKCRMMNCNLDEKTKIQIALL